MLTLDLNTLPRDFSRLSAELSHVSQQHPPDFVTYTPDLQTLYSLAGKYAAIANFIIIGRGGAISGFKAVYHALAGHRTTKHVHSLDTLDPDYVSHLKQRCRPDDTLVVAVSKSGATIDVIENLLCFPDYRKVLVTELGENGLRLIGQRKELEIVTHPPIGGRFSTRTEAAMLPAALIYVDVRSIVEGMRTMSERCSPSVSIEQNPALRLAAALYLCDQQGLHEVYGPVYSRPLSGSIELWTQLMHETVCKQGKGQTFLFMDAPECQHHSNQKFFGGPKRMAGLFIRLERPGSDLTINLDQQTQGISVSGTPLALLDGEHLSEAMRGEWRGVQQAADTEQIPNGTLTLDMLTPSTFGELTAFWEYVAIYSAWLRGVDPFNQPGVELSKKIAREERGKR